MEHMTMARDFAKSFYSSRAWTDCRNAYAKSVGGLCERCLAHGIYRPGEIVHHKCYISPDNVNDPTVTLNWENLELLCREHHAEEHEGRKQRYRLDALGRVVTN